jgi:Fanconi anemia group M protein
MREMLVSSNHTNRYNTFKPKIIYDYRERKSLVIEYLTKLAKIEESILSVGDYVLSDNIICERKTCQDFAKSIIDARLFEQLKFMKMNYKKPILILEGNDLYEYLDVNVIQGAIASIIVDFSIPILQTKSANETARILTLIAKREQLTERRTPRIREGKKPEILKELQEYLVAGLPGIDHIRAKNLLKHFHCPEFVFTATERELRQVQGIGRELSKKIRKVLETEYKDIT